MVTERSVFEESRYCGMESVGGANLLEDRENMS